MEAGQIFDSFSCRLQFASAGRRSSRDGDGDGVGSSEAIELAI
jgi:hypothetical protein